MVPSLEKLCGASDMVVLLNHPRSKREIFSLSKNRENFKEWINSLHKVMSEILKDYNPMLKNIIPRYLTPIIAFDMVNLVESLRENFDLSLTLCQNIIKSSIFASNGLIDEQKAARELVKEPSLNTFLKYNIACKYFLEDIVPGLWKELQNNEPNFKKILCKHNSETPMVMWSEYLEDISKSNLYQGDTTRKFKERVFRYGLKYKNVSAVKFSYDSKGGSRKEIKLLRKNVRRYYCDYISSVLKDLEPFFGSIDSHLCADLLPDRNIIIHFLSLMNKKELHFFLQKFDFSYKIYKWFLLWPYRYPLMDFANIVFKNLGVEEYSNVIGGIISVIFDQYMCQYYNYRLLLREFLISTPSRLKEELISSESGQLQDPDDDEFIYTFVITLLFHEPNFTADFLNNINLILENANTTDRENILNIQGHQILYTMIHSCRSFSMANLFFKTMDLNQETIETCKKIFLFNTFDHVMRYKSMNFVEEIFRWVVGNDDIDDFKDRFFQLLTNSNKMDHLFVNLKEETPFCFLNKILKWFLKTDENIKEWEKNIEYSPLIEYKNYEWLDQLLKYRGYCYEEALDFKRELLYRSLPEIASLSLNYTNVVEFLNMNVLYLCLFKREKLQEFIDHLRSFYKNSIEEKVCLLCLNNNLVHGNGGEGELHCEEHGIQGFISYNEIDDFCSPFLDRIDYLLEERERKIIFDLNSQNM